MDANSDNDEAAMTVALHIYSRVLPTHVLSDAIGLEPDSIWSAGPRSEQSALANLATICCEVEVTNPNACLLLEAVESLLFERLRAVRSKLLSLLEQLAKENEPVPP